MTWHKQKKGPHSIFTLELASILSCFCWFLFPFTEGMQNPDQPSDGWSLKLQNDSCFIFFQTSDVSSDYGTNSTLKCEKSTPIWRCMLSLPPQHLKQEMTVYGQRTAKHFIKSHSVYRKLQWRAVRVSYSQPSTQAYCEMETAETRAQAPDKSSSPLPSPLPWNIHSGMF